MIPWLFCLLHCSIPPLYIDITAQALIDAGRDYPKARVCDSPLDSTLMVAAQNQAEYQAKRRQQGHQLWDKRIKVLHKKFPSYNFQEICAESWDDETNDPLYYIGWGMFKAWAYYPTGHWDVVKQRHDMFGAGMALGRDGIWYACIIVGDEK